MHQSLLSFIFYSVQLFKRKIKRGLRYEDVRFFSAFLQFKTEQCQLVMTFAIKNGSMIVKFPTLLI